MLVCWAGFVVLRCTTRGRRMTPTSTSNTNCAARMPAGVTVGVEVGERCGNCGRRVHDERVLLGIRGYQDPAAGGPSGPYAVFGGVHRQNSNRLM